MKTDSRIFLIAETAWNHEGDYNYFVRLIDKAVSSRADIIKLHLMLNIDEYMLPDHPDYAKLASMMFTKGQWDKIIQKILKKNKELMLLVNDMESIEFCKKYYPKYIEIHSVALNDFQLINRLNDSFHKDTNIVIGIGGSSLDEIENAINLIEYQNIILMYGFQNFPTKYWEISFNKMRRLIKFFNNHGFGYSDHTAWDETDNLLITLFGASTGVKYIEKHITLDYGKKRIDNVAAISIEMLDMLKEKLELLEDCNGSDLVKLNNSELRYSISGLMKKNPFLRRFISSGESLSIDDICFLRTNQFSNISQLEIYNLIGRKLNRDLSKGQILMREFFE